MDNNSEKFLTNGLLIAGAYFLVVRPILKTIGIDPQTQQTIDNVSNAQPAGNPFSPNFQYSLYSLSPNAYNATFFQGLKAQYDAASSHTYSGDIRDIAINGEIIYNSFGYFTESEDNVNGVFNQIQYQSDVANIACYLNFNYSSDLWSLLNNGKMLVYFLKNGLSASALAAIVNRVNSLPVAPAAYVTTGN